MKLQQFSVEDEEQKLLITQLSYERGTIKLTMGGETFCAFVSKVKNKDGSWYDNLTLDDLRLFLDGVEELRSATNEN